MLRFWKMSWNSVIFIVIETGRRVRRLRCLATCKILLLCSAVSWWHPNWTLHLRGSRPSAHHTVHSQNLNFASPVLPTLFKQSTAERVFRLWPPKITSEIRRCGGGQPGTWPLKCSFPTLSKVLTSVSLPLKSLQQSGVSNVALASL